MPLALRASTAPAAPVLSVELVLDHADGWDDEASCESASEQGRDADGAELELPSTDEMALLGEILAQVLLDQPADDGICERQKKRRATPSCSGRPVQGATSLLGQVRVRTGAWWCRAPVLDPTNSESVTQ